MTPPLPLASSYYITLLAKCEDAVLKVERAFSSPGPTLVRDLFQTGERLRRHPDCVSKLGLEVPATEEAVREKVRAHTGLYIFGAPNGDATYTPVYVGISRHLLRRMRQHAFGKSKLEASLCRRKARYEFEQGNVADDLDSERERQQEKLKDYAVLVIREASDYDLYFMEVYLAGRLGTRWNSFRTH
jgi:hypothetical protein